MYRYKATMIKVIDGDTMDFKIDLGFKITHEIRVRLKFIDTAEIFRPKSAEEKKRGQAAKQFVINNYLGETGVLTTYKDKKGKYGRYLAEFILDIKGQQKQLSFDLQSHGFAK